MEQICYILDKMLILKIKKIKLIILSNIIYRRRKTETNEKEG